MRYSSFNLWVDLDPEGLRIEASWPETEEATGPVWTTPPPSVGAIRPGTDVSGGTREVDVSERSASRGTQEIGGEFFRAIFPREVYGLWYKALAGARKERTGVRLRLHLGADLWDWPWELLFDELQGFLVNATSPPVSIVRSLDAPVYRRFRGVARIRILVVAAQPRGLERLNVEEEWRELRRGVARLRRMGRVRLEKLNCPTLSQLEEKLSSGRFHVVHFIGHGEFTADGEGIVLFEDANGGPDRVDGVRLGGVLSAHRALRLVVLNSCKGALDGTIRFAGVAQSLIRQRIPAVVAMQDPILDQDAIRFTRRFYEGLARGGSIDHAVSRSRIGLLADKPGNAWSTPVLYLQVSEGEIFPFPWKQLAAVVLSTFPVVLAFAIPSMIDDHPPYPGPPTPSLPSTAVVEGCPPSELLGMTFVRIPKGTFTMGSKPRDPDELEHDVTISKDFCTSVFEVTRGQYRKIMGAVPGKTRLNPDLPVTGVSWKDSQEFLRRLNQRDPGARYRLPWEAEWEYAARAGAPTRFGFGDDPDELHEYGNCESEAVNDGYDGLAPVGSFRPNRWGLFDMHGNASEWVEDWYGDYGAEAVSDPKGPEHGDEKVRRGGSFEIIPENCDAVTRNSSRPDRRAGDVGFRLVREVEPPR